MAYADAVEQLARQEAQCLPPARLRTLNRIPLRAVKCDILAWT